jgi:pimeloyl-ACP methyl ester carboxylesterase
MSIQAFTINIPQAKLDDLQKRLDNSRLPDELPDVDWTYGVPTVYIKDLLESWRSFDWRKLEAKLNQYPQFTTTIDGQNIHFFHIQSPQADALPLIATHGWPGSFLEYIDVIDLLTNPKNGEQAFHLVIPSIPGFGFSGQTKEKGWNRFRVARAWAELMKRLGYERYGAIGNDAGSFIAPEVGRVDAEHVVGVHVTQIFSFPSGDPAEFANFTPEDYAALQHLQWFNMSAFNKLQSQQPQTLAYALHDSPVGQLAWSGQLFGNAVGKDFTLSNVMLYWLTETANSSARFYYEDAHAEYPTEPTTVPMGLAMFAGDFISFRSFSDRDHKNIVHWKKYDVGGHYAAHQAPEVFAADVREFFGSLR